MYDVYNRLSISKMATVLQRSLSLGRLRAAVSGRRMMANSESSAPPPSPPRVLITGGLGQLGSGLAKELR